MADREKVFDAIRNCITEPKCRDCPWDDCKRFDCKRVDVPVSLLLDVLKLLKEQEERGKGICKRICDFIRRSCSVDTEADKEYVCHVIQQIFIKGWL